MNTARSFSVLLTSLAPVLFAACSPDSRSKHEPLSALAEKVREKRETTKIGADIAQGLGLREEIQVHGQLVTDGTERHSIMITDANDIILIFGTSSVAYFCRTDFSGKLRRVFVAQPGQPQTRVAVTEAQWRFEEEIAFWKAYLGVITASRKEWLAFRSPCPITAVDV
jgi:hypothetical protein